MSLWFCLLGAPQGPHVGQASTAKIAACLETGTIEIPILDGAAGHRAAGCVSKESPTNGPQ